MAENFSVAVEACECIIDGCQSILADDRATDKIAEFKKSTDGFHNLIWDMTRNCW
jgi:hypothetical protein